MKNKFSTFNIIFLSLLSSQLKAECMSSTKINGSEAIAKTTNTFLALQKTVDVLENKILSYNDNIEKRVESVVSLFENSKLSPVYEYIEDINDGRGFTAGKIGFTTGTGDLILVVKEYLKLNPKADPAWLSLMPTLIERSKDLSGTTKGLEALPDLWKKACIDPLFIQAQNNITNELYKNPAKKRLKEFGLHSPLAYLVFYDTMVQHGDDPDSVGDQIDPDGFSGILKRMPVKLSNEKEFLTAFLKARREVLSNANNVETRDAWRDSVTRVDALQDLIGKNAMSLEGDVVVRVWNTDFKLP